jgi:hypothetical protein
MEHVDVPPADYSNLTAVMIEVPKKWKRLRKIMKKDRSELLAYGDWIKETILTNTSPGDHVLTYAQELLYNQHVLDRAEDPAQPVDFQGRSLNSEHYGSGIGRNIWKHKGVVVLVGDYFLPRSAAVAEVHGWSERPITPEGLKQAEGVRVYGDVYMPQGDYRLVHEGHALRWMKQAAMRGAAREHLDEGGCGHMKLVILTADPNMVLRSWSRLFPGAPAPKTAHVQAVLGKAQVRSVLDNRLGQYVDGSRDKGGYDGLVQLLRVCTEACISGDVIWEKLGIRSCDLKAALNSPGVAPTASTYGWTVVRAKELGRPGRGNWLVNWQRFAAQANDKVVLKVASTGR